MSFYILFHSFSAPTSRGSGCICTGAVMLQEDLKLLLWRGGGVRWLSRCPSELQRNPVLSYTFHAKQPQGILLLMSTASSELAKFRMFFVQTPSNTLISICFWKNSWLTILRLSFTLRVIYKSSASFKCYLTWSRKVSEVGRYCKCWAMCFGWIVCSQEMQFPSEKKIFVNWSWI